MPSKTFPKAYLQDVINSDAVVESRIIDLRRWSSFHEVVFKHEDSLYAVTYSQGLTESQDEQPFEYDEENIECVEVKPVETSVITYQPV